LLRRSVPPPNQKVNAAVEDRPVMSDDVVPGDVIAAGITELGVEITVPIVAPGE